MHVFGVGNMDGISHLRRRLLGCGKINYLHYMTCCFMYRLLAFQQPTYLFERLNFATSPRTYTTIDHLLLTDCHYGTVSL